MYKSYRSTILEISKVPTVNNTFISFVFKVVLGMSEMTNYMTS